MATPIEKGREMRSVTQGYPKKSQEVELPDLQHNDYARSAGFDREGLHIMNLSARQSCIEKRMGIWDESVGHQSVIKSESQIRMR
jgi:hypothetical protein